MQDAREENRRICQQNVWALRRHAKIAYVVKADVNGPLLLPLPAISHWAGLTFQ